MKQSELYKKYSIQAKESGFIHKDFAKCASYNRNKCLLGMIVLLHISAHNQRIYSDVKAVHKAIAVPSRWWD